MMYSVIEIIRANTIEEDGSETHYVAPKRYAVVDNEGNILVSFGSWQKSREYVEKMNQRFG